MKTDKELADDLDARDRLLKRGYKWKSCPHCRGLGEQREVTTIAFYKCVTCDGRGGTWEAPITS